MTPAELKMLREKHIEKPVWDWEEDSPTYCHGCADGEADDLEDNFPYPCVIVKLINELNQAAINYERGWGDGFRASVADAEWDHWADGNDD